MNPYGDLIHEHSRRPRNYGALEGPDIRAEVDNPLCGDRVRIELALAADGTVHAARFQGDLCMIARAAASLLTEMVTGRPLQPVPEEQQLLDALHAEIKPARRKCALLPLEALRAGVNGYRSAR
ncbi:MAG TPA: iron-sulfur cluster assembly scaffold protein [Thermoanaerobaculia bacterium]|jgi:nitrogen fixation NifU-like protein|nr:iron-sulfur cluster assembly scaffold protein [Thermoanaerobaculia bacterium]